MSKEFSDVSGEYGPGPRCTVCHSDVHDQETGPLCENLKLQIRVSKLEAAIQATLNRMGGPKGAMIDHTEVWEKLWGESCAELSEAVRG